MCTFASLDFLRKCRELSEWYGPSFYFVGNPLMLPFPLHPALESGAIDVTQQVEYPALLAAFVGLQP
jgi:hypothetical protein